MSQGFVGEAAIWTRILLALLGVGACVLFPYCAQRARAPQRERAAAAEHLRRIAAAQEAFRANDGDLDLVEDYGSLTELGRVSAALEGHAGQAPGSGYVFAAAPGADPRATWFAFANPAGEGVALFLNQEGRLYSRTEPYAVAEVASGCAPPAGSEPLGD